AVGVAAAATNQEAHGIHQRQGTTNDGVEAFADRHVFPVADLGAADLLRLLHDAGIKRIIFFLGIVVGGNILVLPRVPRSLAFVTRAGAKRARQEIAVLVEVAG